MGQRKICWQFDLLNGYDVEHASSMLVYENLFPEIQHINNKGCIDKYTTTQDVDSVTYIDIVRVLASYSFLLGLRVICLQSHTFSVKASAKFT